MWPKKWLPKLVKFEKEQQSRTQHNIALIEMMCTVIEIKNCGQIKSPGRHNWRREGGRHRATTELHSGISLHVYKSSSYPWSKLACSILVSTLLFLGLRRLPLYFLRQKALLLNRGCFCHISALLWGARVSDTHFLWLPSRIRAGDVPGWPVSSRTKTVLWRSALLLLKWEMNFHPI